MHVNARYINSTRGTSSGGVYVPSSGGVYVPWLEKRAYPRKCTHCALSLNKHIGLPNMVHREQTTFCSHKSIPNCRVWYWCGIFTLCSNPGVGNKHTFLSYWCLCVAGIPCISPWTPVGGWQLWPLSVLCASSLPRVRCRKGEGHCFARLLQLHSWSLELSFHLTSNYILWLEKQTNLKQ